MASAKRLSTAELGATRYHQAENSRLWPVEVRLPSHLDPTEHLLHVPDRQPVSFQHDVQGICRAFLSVPVGPLTYEIRRGDDLVSTGGLTVRPPDAPMTREKHAAGLTARPPSGATQIEKDLDDDQDDWPVHFLFEEETWAARSVAVVSDALRDDVPLTRGADGAFRGETRLGLGELEYRFAVVPREPTRADQAPFTRLGWDDAASKPHKLITWPLSITVEVKEAQNKRPKGANGSAHAASATIYGSFDQGNNSVAGGDQAARSPVSTGDAQTGQSGHKGRGGDGSVWTVAVALASVVGAFGALVVMNRKGGADTPGPVIQVEADNVGTAEKGADNVLRHSRSHSM